MKTRVRTTGLLLAMILGTTLSAQNQDCYIKKSYPSRPGTTLRISSKYGNVNFIAAKSDSISICATVTIEHDNSELVRKSLNLISVKIDKVNDTVSVLTIIDKKFFSETYRLGRKSFSVDMMIRAPSYINIDIINEFGNVTADDISGRFNVRLSYGLLSATKISRGYISPVNSVNVDNGKIFLDGINWMSATIRNCSSAEIGKAQALMIKSDFSKIRIKSVNSMIADSKSDIYRIDTLKNLVSESIYTSINILKFSGKMLSNVTYGSINIDELLNDFSDIDITSVNAPISIAPEKGVSFRTDIVVTNAALDFPLKDEPGIVKNDSNNSTSCNGIYGNNKMTESLIKIRSTAGKVTLR